MARPRKLTEAKELAVVRRYELGKRNRPRVIAMDLGIGIDTIYKILRRRQKENAAWR